MFVPHSIALMNDSFVEAVARHVQDVRPMSQHLKLKQRPLTLCGPKRIRNVLELSARALAEGVPGDFVETGVYHGGVSMVLAARLEAERHPSGRSLWAADSLKGFSTERLE